MKTLILYKTKHGSTKQYAKWLHEDLPNADVKNIKDFNSSEIANYERIIYGTCEYMGRITGKRFLTSNWDNLKTKKVYFFTVGMASMDNEESKKAYGALPQEIRDGLIGYIKLPGKVEMAKLGFFMRWITKKMGDGKDEDKMDRSLLQTILKAIN